MQHVSSLDSEKHSSPKTDKTKYVKLYYLMHLWDISLISLSAHVFITAL